MSLSVLGAGVANAQPTDGRDAVVPSSYSRDELPVLSSAAEVQTAASGSLWPTVTCYVKLDKNNRRTYFGYESTFGSSVSVPIGFWNWATPGGNEGQPTALNPGVHDAVFSIDHPNSSTEVWYLGWYFETTKKAKKCKDDQVPAFANPALAAVLLTAIGGAGAVGVRRRRTSVGDAS